MSMRFLTTQRYSLLAVAFALVLPLMLKSGSLATELLIFAMAALACNLLLGFTGLMSFGQGIFYGLGSYAAGLLLLHFDVPILVALAGSVAFGAAVAGIVGWFSIRQRGVYFVMLTLAFSQMFYFLAYSLKDITGGDNGLLGIPRPDLQVLGLFSLSISNPWQFYSFVAVIFVIIFAALQRVSESCSAERCSPSATTKHAPRRWDTTSRRSSLRRSSCRARSPGWPVACMHCCQGSRLCPTLNITSARPFS